MKNTIDSLVINFCYPVKISLSELQRRNLTVEFYLENQIKAKVRLLSTLNYWDIRNPLFIVELKGLRSKKMWKEISLSSFKARATLKKQTAGPRAKLYRELGQKMQAPSQHYYKVFDKDRSPPQKVKKSASKLG
jgi:hypothetical protein